MAQLDSTTFPTRPECFGRDAANASCTIPSPSMVNFLNITDPWTYKQMYCINPPADSCAFGYCANPDIASPAVRAATYTSTVCLAIIILYNPEAIVDSFYAQLLQLYSLMIAAIVAIGLRQLTRLHAAFALTAAGSPLSLYLLYHALRSLFTRSVLRLDAVFGPSRGARGTFNRCAVLIGLPLWITILAVIARPNRVGWFQQTACDSVFGGSLVSRFYYGPIYLVLSEGLGTRMLVLAPVVALIGAWIVALILQRRNINSNNLEIGPVRRVWRAVTDTYPFIRFCTIILVPFAIWIATLETGALFSNEYFTPTYGQILAIAAAIPPLIQCFCLISRLRWWFVDLTWVRYITRRKNAPYHDNSSKLAPGSYHNLYDDIGRSSNNGANTSEYSKLDDSNIESLDAGVVAKNPDRYSYVGSIASVASDSTVVPLHDIEGYKPTQESVAYPMVPTASFGPSVPHSSSSAEDGTHTNVRNTQVPSNALLSENPTGQGRYVDPYERYRLT